MAPAPAYRTDLMRLLHTSDWHLGHTLRDYERGPEHAAFVSWLLDVIDEERIDVLLVAGDVFETANPSAAAQEAWYAFLAAARRRAPDLDLIVIGGNHDSAARLDAGRSGRCRLGAVGRFHARAFACRNAGGRGGHY